MILTKSMLKNHYFYKTELIELCRNRKLPTYGTKAELKVYLQKFLSGIPPQEIKPARTIQAIKEKNNKLTLKTRLIGEGFKFNDLSRHFFAEYYHLPKFKFKKEMAVIKRRVETEHDTMYTVQDLIEELNHSEFIIDNKNSEEQTYQWNNFVRDFNKDPESKKFHSKMKVAAILWQHVRDSEGTKKFDKKLISKYYDQIKNL